MTDSRPPVCQASDPEPRASELSGDELISDDRSGMLSPTVRFELAAPSILLGSDAGIGFIGLDVAAGDGEVWVSVPSPVVAQS